MPLVVRKTLRTFTDHRARRVHTGDPAAMLDEVLGDRHAGSAADVKHRGGLRKESQKPVQPSLFNQTVATVTRPRIRVSLVDLDDPAILRSHKARPRLFSAARSRSDHALAESRPLRP